MGKKRIVVLGEPSIAKAKEGKEKKSRLSRLKIEDTRSERPVKVGDARHEVSAKSQKIVKTNLPSHKLVKLGKQHGHIADVGAEALEEATIIEEKKALSGGGQEVKKEIKPKKVRSQKYLQVKKQIDKNKFYPLSEAIKTLKKISISHFNGSVDVHLNVKETGLKGELEFPHPTGKTQVVKIADEQLINDLEKGKVNFTILIATPQMMPKLVKFAKLLGPKGLMPNPKSGTISDQPEETAKKIIQKTQFRTETKAPLIHFSIGKVNDPEKNLEENFKAIIKAVGKRNIQKAVLAPTMGPSIKIDLASV